MRRDTAGRTCRDVQRIPNVLRTGNKKIAIAFDGAAYHSDELIWHHDIYRQTQLEKEGFIIHRIWSANWWKNPVVELEKLVEFLLLIKA